MIVISHFSHYISTKNYKTYGDVQVKTNRGQDVQLFVCSFVVEKPGGCWYKLIPGNAKIPFTFLFISLNKFHSLF